jgi:signal transduction histidine kinase
MREKPMKDKAKTKAQLIEELAALRLQVNNLKHLQRNGTSGQPERLPYYLIPGEAAVHEPVEAERERLLAAEREQRLLAETLGDVFLILAAQTSREAVLDEILHQMQRLVSYTTANIALLEEGQFRMVRWQGQPKFGDFNAMSTLTHRLEDYPLDVRVVAARQPVIVPDTSLEPDWRISEHSRWIRAYVSVPICLGDKVLGLLRLNNDRPGAFSDKDIERLRPLANAAAIALENARLYDQARDEIKERKLIEQELRQSQAKNRALLGAIPDLMFRITRDGQYLDCQEGTDWGLTIPSSADIGKNVREVMPPEIAAQTLTHAQNALDTGMTQIFHYQLPLSDNGPEEATVDVVDYETRLVISGPNEVLGIVSNITERKRSERRVIRTERLAALGQLAAALAHEMNNPLQVIQSHLDLVLDFPLDPGESDRYLYIIRQEIERLTDVTRRVLNYARPQANHPQLISLTDLIDQVITLTGKRLEQSKITVKIELQDVPPVLAAPDQLIQVFLNLVINAIEAMSEGGALQVKLFRRADHVIASFTNEGEPIPPAVLSHIFEPFYTTKPEGSGLGLWVSHSLVQQHAGTLTVKNLPNRKGVMFSVQLPAVLLSPGETIPQEAGSPDGTIPGMKIMGTQGNS